MPLELDVFLSREVAAADVPLTHSFGIARNPRTDYGVRPKRNEPARFSRIIFSSGTKGDVAALVGMLASAPI